MVGGLPVWVCADAVDFRLGIDGLALRVQASLVRISPHRDR